MRVATWMEVGVHHEGHHVGGRTGKERDLGLMTFGLTGLALLCVLSPKPLHCLGAVGFLLLLSKWSQPTFSFSPEKKAS